MSNNFSYFSFYCCCDKQPINLPLVQACPPEGRCLSGSLNLNISVQSASPTSILAGKIGPALKGILSIKHPLLFTQGI